MECTKSYIYCCTENQHYLYYINSTYDLRNNKTSSTIVKNTDISKFEIQSLKIKGDIIILYDKKYKKYMIKRRYQKDFEIHCPSLQNEFNITNIILNYKEYVFSDDKGNYYCNHFYDYYRRRLNFNSIVRKIDMIGTSDYYILSVLEDGICYIDNEYIEKINDEQYIDCYCGKRCFVLKTDAFNYYMFISHIIGTTKHGLIMENFRVHKFGEKIRIPIDEDIKKISIGDYNIAILGISGKVYYWHHYDTNKYNVGKDNDVTTETINIPHLLTIDEIDKFADIAICSSHLVLVPQNNLNSCLIIGINKFNINDHTEINYLNNKPINIMKLTDTTNQKILELKTPIIVITYDKKINVPKPLYWTLKSHKNCSPNCKAARSAFAMLSNASIA